MPLNNLSPLLPFVKRLSELSPLDGDDQAMLFDLTGRVTQAKANVDIVSPGEEVDHACLVIEGLVGTFGQLRDGKRQITALHLAGDMADLHCVAIPRAASAIEALTTSTIMRVPLSQLRNIAAESPAIAQAFWTYSAVATAILSRWTINIGRKGAQGRLAHLLCEIGLRMEQAGHGDRHGYTLEASQPQLGDALGLTAVHVNRTFKALRTSQLVAVEGRTIRIHNWPGLATLGDFDPDYLQLEEPLQRAA